MSARQSTLRAPRHKKKDDTKLKVVRRNKRGLIKRGSQRRIAPFLVLGGIFVVGIVFAILLAQVVLAQSGFEMARLREQTVKAEARHAELVLQAARLGSAERIERVAIEELGMVHPTRVEYIVADVGSRGTARLAQERTTENVDMAGQAASGPGTAP
jgi:cell division protein FtsL